MKRYHEERNIFRTKVLYMRKKCTCGSLEKAKNGKQISNTFVISACTQLKLLAITKVYEPEYVRHPGQTMSYHMSLCKH